MGKIELDHTGSGGGITLSSDGTDLLLDGTAIGGGGGSALELYAENPSSATAPSATGTNAVAIGSGTIAQGPNDVVLGTDSDTTTLGDSVAIGNNARSQALRGLAIGYNSRASNRDTIAIGSDTHCFSNEAMALGHNAISGGTQAVALSDSYASGTDSFAAAIATNSSSYGATGSNSIAMGYQAKATNTYSATFGGFRCQTTGGGAASLGGFDNVASGSYSTVIGGRDSTADASYSYALGRGSHTQGIESRMAFAGSASNGDMQSGYFCLAKNTTDATATALVTNVYPAASTTNQIILPNNSAYAFHGTIVARQQASGGTASAAWKVEGLIRREGSAGTTVLVNSATTVLDNTPSWGMALSADTTNGGLAITVTGAASTNIRWVATIHTSEVTYA